MIFLNKEQKVERIKEMLQSLAEENDHGGFNEFPQFCEHWLRENLHYLSNEGLNSLVSKIERNSELAISLRNPQGQIQLIKMGIR